MAVQNIPLSETLRVSNPKINQNFQDLDTGLNGKADAGHTHDARYYTETEADGRFAGLTHKSRHASGGADPLLPGDIGAASSAHSHVGEAITSGTVSPARLGAGTRDGTKYLRDDGAWSAVPGGGASQRRKPLTRVPFSRLVALAASSEFSAAYPASRAVDGNDHIYNPNDTTQRGWLTAQKAVSTLASEWINIRVGSMLWVTLGDSITEGQYEHTPSPDRPGAPPNAWAGWDNPFSSIQIHLQEMQGRTVVNQGMGGERTDQILAAISTRVHALKPDVCSVLAGTNDMIQDIALSTIQSNLTSIYNSLVSNGTLPVLCTLPPITNNEAAGRTTKFNNLNQWIRDRAAANNWPLVDFYAVMEDPANPGRVRAGDYHDTVHPTEQGYARMATAFEPMLDKVIPAPRLAALGLAVPPSGTGLADFIKPNGWRIERWNTAGQTFGVRERGGFDVPVDSTRRWIDHIYFPPAWRDDDNFSTFRITPTGFAGDQALSKYTGLGEVRVYVQY